MFYHLDSILDLNRCWRSFQQNIEAMSHATQAASKLQHVIASTLYTLGWPQTAAHSANPTKYTKLQGIADAARRLFTPAIMLVATPQHRSRT